VVSGESATACGAVPEIELGVEAFIVVAFLEGEFI
jgi:hypothetical protein